MSHFPTLIAMDLEGVLVPEIWISVAEKTGIDFLRLTTRDIADYSVLMKGRLDTLKKHGLTLKDIQEVIDTIEPYDGALDFLNWQRENAMQSVILSDTFYQFATPLMRKLGFPTLFCNTLQTDESGAITGYTMRINDGKRHAALAFKNLNFDVVAMGDSYNDVAMLREADLGILFRPAEKVRQLCPQYPVATDYETLKRLISAHIAE